MQFNLTFNKPAVTMFLAEGATAVKVKVVGKGQVQFKPVNKEGGRDVFPLSSRTRGGMGITIGGRFAEEFLQSTRMDRSTHLFMEKTGYNWIAAQAVEGKPSKIHPTARLWRSVDESASKEATAPVRAPRKAKVIAKAAATTTRKPRNIKAEAVEAKADASEKKTRAPRTRKAEATAAA